MCVKHDEEIALLLVIHDQLLLRLPAQRPLCAVFALLLRNLPDQFAEELIDDLCA